MAMNRIMSFLGLSLAALFGGCGASPTSHDVVGTWANPDGAELTFEENGQFFARAIPQALFFRSDQVGVVDGKGSWKLEKGKPYWEAKLSFKEIAGRPAGYATSVLVSGGGASTYLYQWKGEEGEARYKFERKTSTAR